MALVVVGLLVVKIAVLDCRVSVPLAVEAEVAIGVVTAVVAVVVQWQQGQ